MYEDDIFQGRIYIIQCSQISKTRKHIRQIIIGCAETQNQYLHKQTSANSLFER